MLDFYLINENTLAIIPEKNYTKIIEKYVTYNIKLFHLEIIKNSCLFYKSSYEGRVEFSRYYLGSKYKTPIIISEEKNIIFFPTSAPNNVDCMWINYKGISKFYSNNLSTVNLELINNKLLTINESNRVISNQVLKSSRLDMIFKKR